MKRFVFFPLSFFMLNGSFDSPKMQERPLLRPVADRVLVLEERKRPHRQENKDSQQRKTEEKKFFFLFVLFLSGSCGFDLAWPCRYLLLFWRLQDSSLLACSCGFFSVARERRKRLMVSGVAFVDGLSCLKTCSVGKLSVNQWQESRETRQALLQKRMDDAVAQKRAAFLAKQKQQ
jgi:hypothetical protein